MKSWRSILSFGFAILALMLVHGWLVMDTAWQSSPTVDEVAHLPAGQSYFDRHTFRMYRHSPPLARLLAAGCANVFGHELEVDYEGVWAFDQPANHWRFAFETLAHHQDSPGGAARYLSAFDSARLGTCLISVVTVPVLFYWGYWWFGPVAGLVSAALWCFSPNVIAHAGLVTTDLAMTSVSVIAGLAFARWLDRPTWLRATWLGVALGLAQLVKFSALWLYPLFMVWFCVHVVCRSRWMLKRKIGAFVPNSSSHAYPHPACTHGTTLWGSLWQSIVAVIMSVLVIDAGYLFEGVGTPLGEFAFLSRSLTRPRTPEDIAPPVSNNRSYMQVWAQRANVFDRTLLAWLPCPLPHHYVAGFDEQKFESEGMYPMYLRGAFAESLPADDPWESTGRRGWWYYYLYALAIKVPLGTWLLVLLASTTAWRFRSHRSIAPWVFMTLGPIVLMSVLTDINIGVRYALPVLPYVFLWGGSLARVDARVWLKFAALAGVIWNVGAVARIHPHELEYFNELVGGPMHGREHLIDSNIDWGEGLRQLARWMEKHPEWKGARLAYFGTTPPEFEGIEDYRLAPRDLRFVLDERLLPWEKRDDPQTWGPQPGKFAVSVNFERGMRFHTPAPLGELLSIRQRSFRALVNGSRMVEVPSGSFSYFQHWTPRVIPDVGYSILLYDVSVEEADRLRAQMGLPRWKSPIP